MPLIRELIEILKPIEVIGNIDSHINRVVQLNSSIIEADDLLWCSDKNAGQLKTIQKGTIILSPLAFQEVKSTNQSFGQSNWIVINSPRRAFMQVLRHFFMPQISRVISSSAHIDSSVSLGKNCTIGHGVVIEKNCRIGNNVIIGHNTVLQQDTIVEDDVIIGSNCTIGGVGFGYEKDEEGNFEFIPHIGNVHIHQKVEIGNNTTIDRAVIGSTRIGENVKIDNLVHIAHGVQIGENTLIIANAMVAGSAIVGSNVWIAPSANILQKTTIGDDVLVGIGSLVLKNIPANKVVAGSPARILRDQYPESK